jgi:hypothetical protein
LADGLSELGVLAEVFHARPPFSQRRCCGAKG